MNHFWGFTSVNDSPEMKNQVFILKITLYRGFDNEPLGTFSNLFLFELFWFNIKNMGVVDENIGVVDENLGVADYNLGVAN